MVRCVSCGRESPDSFKFCQSCGAILARPIDLRDSRLEAPRQMISRAVYERRKTDRKLSILWIVAIILAIVTTIALTMATFFAMFADFDSSSDYLDSFSWMQVVSNVLGFVVTALLAVLTYLLVKRQNDHYDREARLRRGLVSLINAAAWSPERMNDIAPEMMALSAVERRREKPRNAWFWVLVVVIPQAVGLVSSVALWLLGTDWDTDAGFRTVIMITLLTAAVALVALVLLLYLLFFLTKTMEEHDGRWNVFAYNARRAMTKLGFRHGVPYSMNRLPERSMPLYVILTLFTGIFVYYWIYILIKDPNDHFTYQWGFEDNIMSAMNPYQDPTTFSVSPP